MEKIIVAFMVILLSACTLGTAVTPRQKVSEFLDKYKNQNTDIISQLEETIETDITNTDHRDRYKTLMTNQYKNMEYEIIEEIVEEDNAVVEVEITVYDYASAIRNSNDYLNNNPDKFTNEDKATIDTDDNTENNNDTDMINEENAEDETTKESDNDSGIIGNYDEDKFMDYKLSQMENVTDTVKYTIEFTLTKVNDEWQLDELSNSDIEKLHGIFIS